MKKSTYRVSAHRAVFNYKKCRSIIPRKTKKRREKERGKKREREREREKRGQRQKE